MTLVLKRLLKLLYYVILVASLITYVSPHISPSKLWVTAFLPFLLPLVLGIHFLLILFFIIKQRWPYVAVSLFVVLYGLTFLHDVFAVNFKEKVRSEKSFSVMSYNVRVFNVYHEYNHHDIKKSINLINDAINMEGDIKCFQEFYNESNSMTYNTYQKLKKKYKYSYFEPFFINEANGQFGMAIFSKFPLENKGSLKFKEKSNNQILYADVKISDEQVVRIFNVHLQSMNIKEENLSTTNHGFFRRMLVKTLLTYRKGAITRSKQVDKLIQEINQSPYPVIVCGDFNEPPVGYAYQQVAQLLKNAHSNYGLGVGATHIGFIPFLRIDNQFYAKELKLNYFEIDKSKKLSDHYPLIGNYSF